MTHAEELDALRETAAPIGSYWRHRDGTTWRVLSRIENMVQLGQVGGTRRKIGPLVSLLKRYTQCQM
jgi:hypothetical protein